TQISSILNSNGDPNQLDSNSISPIQHFINSIGEDERKFPFYPDLVVHSYKTKAVHASIKPANRTLVDSLLELIKSGGKISPVLYAEHETLFKSIVPDMCKGTHDFIAPSASIGYNSFLSIVEMYKKTNFP